jgi:hypothetical protein
MVRWSPDERAARLLEPVRGVLDRAGQLLPDAPPLAITVGTVRDPDATWALSDPGTPVDGVTLSALLEVGIHHPVDAGRPFGLDRWRRAAASVLEAAATRELSRRTGLPPGRDWRWVGGAVHAADAVAPELQLAGPDLALALETGSPGTRPRAGLAVMRAWVAGGVDPLRQVVYLLEGGVLSAAEWAKLGQWVFTQLPATLPGPVDRVTDAEHGADGLVVPPWTWQPFRRPADARGAQLALEGDGVVEPAWAPAGQELRAVVSAAGGPVRVVDRPGAPPRGLGRGLGRGLRPGGGRPGHPVPLLAGRPPGGGAGRRVRGPARGAGDGGGGGHERPVHGGRGGWRGSGGCGSTASTGARSRCTGGPAIGSWCRRRGSASGSGCRACRRRPGRGRRAPRIGWCSAAGCAGAEVEVRLRRE